jgi:hypothetical protein
MTMTKKVRVENADTSNHKVVVQTWVKGQNGEPDTMKEERELNNPTDMGEFWIWQQQYVVIKEA